MANLKKMSVQRLLNLDNGLTTLFYLAMAGMENGGPDINREDAKQFTDLLNHQTDIQKVLMCKVKNLIGEFEFENEHLFDGINDNELDTV